MSRPDFAARRQARIERLEQRAEKLANDSDAAYESARRVADMIPFGQPILVGHHSEKRARRDAQRIHDGMRRSVELAKQADETARRADAAKSNTAIDSDDPDAIDLLREKLTGLEVERDRWKTIIKALRKGPDALAALSPTDREVSDIRFSGGAISYKTKNLGAEIRRVKARIADLEAAATREAPPDEQIGPVTIREQDNRVQLVFPGKPNESVRSELKRNGFRWSPSEGAWQRKPSGWAWHCAREIARKWSA